MMIPLIVEHYEHKNLIIDLKKMDQKVVTKSRNSMKVLHFYKLTFLSGTPEQGSPVSLHSIFKSERPINKTTGLT